MSGRETRQQLYRVAWANQRGDVQVRADTVVSTPEPLRGFVGQPLGKLIHWLSQQPAGAWVAMPEPN